MIYKGGKQQEVNAKVNSWAYYSRFQDLLVPSNSHYASIKAENPPTTLLYFQN